MHKQLQVCSAALKLDYYYLSLACFYRDLGAVEREERRKEREKQQQGYEMRLEYSQTGKEKKQDRQVETCQSADLYKSFIYFVSD